MNIRGTMNKRLDRRWHQKRNERKWMCNDPYLIDYWELCKLFGEPLWWENPWGIITC
jgi:hypothetical protein